MGITWDHEDSWFDRGYWLEHDGQQLLTFDGDPTLDELREAERQHGTRINLWQVGLLCSDCGNDITGRLNRSIWCSRKLNGMEYRCTHGLTENWWRQRLAR